MNLASTSELTSRLLRLIQEMRCGAEENGRWYGDQLQALSDEFAQRRSDLRGQSESSLAALQHEFTERLEAARVTWETKQEQLESERGTRSDELARIRSKTISQGREDFETNQMRLRDELERDQKRLRQRHQQWTQKCQEAMEQLHELREVADDLLDRYRVRLIDPEAVALEQEWVSADSQSLFREMQRSLAEQDTAMADVHRWTSVRFLKQGLSVLVALLAALIVAWPLGYATRFQPLIWAVAVALTALSIGLGTWIYVLSRLRRRLWDQVPVWSHRLDRSATLIGESERASQQELQSALQMAQQQTQNEIERTKAERERLVQQAESDYQRSVQELETLFQETTTRYESEWELETAEIRRLYLPQIKQRTDFFDRLSRELEQEFENRSARTTREHQETRDGLYERWQRAVSDYTESLRSLQSQPGWSPGWDELERWQAPQTTPDAVALGHFSIPLLPTDQDWARELVPGFVPAVLDFGHKPSLILKTPEAGRQAAVQVLQAAALHLLASFPPGTVRFTVFDPLGLGEHFAGLMHLADFDERLIGHRIWTETGPMQQRLLDLTEHMENVIQKYLRNQYASIQDYNRYAGEVAEPFRVLVIANFPHQFSEEAMRRLVRIVQSGPRCGVFTLMSVDEQAKWPRSFSIQELEQNAQVFEWQEGTFVHPEEPWCQLPLQLDQPPDESQTTRLLTAIGQHAQDHRRVEVPFQWVAPATDRYWSYDCSEELVVPLGRSGATQQLALHLGRGTSQHVLIAGKTGSGKSTLLHALITNAALRYSPDELQFYLVDFKKGVEFKPYATQQLAHAAIVAIESEREFGLSVLQRLDQELRRRGDAYREAGVQSLAMFRRAQPEQKMPRILLIVDEFQEFFVKDDRVAHESSLLLDRLVRQGRAFGIHIVLGSQTLAGAYSLARSTLGQMAVRIALECSAADAHVILSEDNTAARLLGRPGEAIYNDANGMLEGNHPFQVVWLPDAQRNEYLQQVAHLVDQSQWHGPPPVVFEGQATADLRENSELLETIERGRGPTDSKTHRAWIGAAVEIKDPISAVFRRQSGTNLLLVGSNRELAEGMLASSMISLALRTTVSQPSTAYSARLWMLSADETDDLNSPWLAAMRDALADTLEISPPDRVVATIAQLTDLMEHRLSDTTVTHRENVYLIVHDLARFRMLQPDPDDFGLGSFSAERASGNAAAQLARILREGPAVGIHTIAWADCYHTVSRWLERTTLRDFAQRVLMQMSAVDSSHLMDSVAASQLGPFRAIFHDHDRGVSEKFRPYGVPDLQWLGKWSRQPKSAMATPTASGSVADEPAHEDQA